MRELGTFLLGVACAVGALLILSQAWVAAGKPGADATHRPPAEIPTTRGAWESAALPFLEKGRTYMLRTFPNGGWSIERAPEGWTEPVRVMVPEASTTTSGWPAVTAYPTCDERNQP